VLRAAVTQLRCAVASISRTPCCALRPRQKQGKARPRPIEGLCLSVPSWWSSVQNPSLWWRGCGKRTLTVGVWARMAEGLPREGTPIDDAPTAMGALGAASADGARASRVLHQPEYATKARTSTACSDITKHRSVGPGSQARDSLSSPATHRRPPPCRRPAQDARGLPLPHMCLGLRLCLV